MKRLILVVTVVILALIANAQIPVDSLVAYWPLNGNVNDESGNNLNGAIYGDPHYVTGVSGQALDFDGIDDYMKISDDEEFTLSDFTISAWIKWEGDPDAQGSWAIVSNWANGYSSEHYGLRMGTISASPDHNHGVFYYDDGTAWDWVYYLKNELSDGLWHNIVGTLKSGDVAKIYFDGTLFETDNSSIPTLIDPTDDLYIARDGYGESSGDVGHWNGIIDEVRIYNRVLTEEEIIAIYNETDNLLKINNKAFNSELIINVYPNPTTGKVNLELDKSYTDVQINVRTIEGKLVQSFNIINSNDLSFDITGIAGMYFVDVISQGEKSVFKVVKE